MRIQRFLPWLLILVLFTGLAGPAPRALARPQGVVSPYDLIIAMNTLRVSYGLPALIEDPIINSVAQYTAEYMAINNLPWHIGDVRGRIAAAGYGGGAPVFATENFAVGNMSIDEIMQVWADPDHMRPAVNPAYCHVGAGVAQTVDGRYYYILQAAYISGQACGDYIPSAGSAQTGGGSGVVIPVKIATPDADGKIYHVVEAGQSFWSIAIAYKITIRDIEIWNNLSRTNGLRIGQRLFIPSSSTEGYATPTPVGMIIPSTPDADGKIIHTVQAYNTLTTIAKAYDVEIDTILALNGIQIDWPLQIGQKLLIFPGNITPSPTPRPLTPLERLTPASDGNYYHTVQSGETLSWIASIYEVTLADLMAWNGLNSASIIRPEQQLILQVTPPATATHTPGPPSATPTITRTAIPPTPTPTRAAAAVLSPTAAPPPQAQSGGAGLALPIIGVLAVLGFIIIVFLSSKRT